MEYMENLKKDNVKADPKLAELALKKIRAVCKGNGVRVDKVSLVDFEGEIYKFGARNDLQPDVVVKQERVPGKRTDGEVVESREFVKPAVDGVVAGILGNASARKRITDSILLRDDRGFFTDETRLDVGGFDKNYIWHEPCGGCGAEGSMVCNVCGGSGKQNCPACGGAGVGICKICRGTGFTQYKTYMQRDIAHNAPKGQNPCYHCHGSKKASCDSCRGSGKIACRACGGKGRIVCSMCKGEGWFSNITNVGVIVNCAFQYDRDALPQLAAVTLDGLRSKAVSEGYVKVEAKAFESRNDANDVDGIGVKYSLEVPFGKLRFKIGKREVTSWVFGNRCKLVNVPNFLDKMVRKGVESLEDAAKGEGFAAAKIKEASKFRLIAFALVMAASLNVKKNAGAILNKFPIGLSKHMALEIAQLSEKAIANITRKPRYVGLGIGSVVAGLIFLAYFLTGIRELVVSRVESPYLHMVVDLMVLGMGGTIAGVFIQLAAGRAMHMAIGHLFSSEKAGKRAMRIKGSGLWGYGGAMVAFLVVLEVVFHISRDLSPWWYVMFRR